MPQPRGRTKAGAGRSGENELQSSGHSGYGFDHDHDLVFGYGLDGRKSRTAFYSGGEEDSDEGETPRAIEGTPNGALGNSMSGRAKRTLRSAETMESDESERSNEEERLLELYYEQSRAPPPVADIDDKLVSKLEAKRELHMLAMEDLESEIQQLRKTKKKLDRSTRSAGSVRSSGKEQQPIKDKALIKQLRALMGGSMPSKPNTHDSDSDEAPVAAAFVPTAWGGAGTTSGGEDKHWVAMPRVGPTRSGKKVPRSQEGIMNDEAFTGEDSDGGEDEEEGEVSEDVTDGDSEDSDVEHLLAELQRQKQHRETIVKKAQLIHQRRVKQQKKEEETYGDYLRESVKGSKKHLRNSRPSSALGLVRGYKAEDVMARRGERQSAAAAENSEAGTPQSSSKRIADPRSVVRRDSLPDSSPQEERMDGAPVMDRQPRASSEEVNRDMLTDLEQQLEELQSVQDRVDYLRQLLASSKSFLKHQNVEGADADESYDEPTTDQTQTEDEKDTESEISVRQKVRESKGYGWGYASESNTSVTETSDAGEEEDDEEDEWYGYGGDGEGRLGGNAPGDRGTRLERADTLESTSTDNYGGNIREEDEAAMEMRLEDASDGEAGEEAEERTNQVLEEELASAKKDLADLQLAVEFSKTLASDEQRDVFFHNYFKYARDKALSQLREASKLRDEAMKSLQQRIPNQSTDNNEESEIQTEPITETASESEYVTETEETPTETEPDDIKNGVTETGGTDDEIEIGEVINNVDEDMDGFEEFAATELQQRKQRMQLEQRAEKWKKEGRIPVREVVTLDEESMAIYKVAMATCNTFKDRSLFLACLMELQSLQDPDLQAKCLQLLVNFRKIVQAKLSRKRVEESKREFEEAQRRAQQDEQDRLLEVANRRQKRRQERKAGKQQKPSPSNTQPLSRPPTAPSSQHRARQQQPQQWDRFPGASVEAASTATSTSGTSTASGGHGHGAAHYFVRHMEQESPNHFADGTSSSSEQDFTPSPSVDDVGLDVSQSEQQTSEESRTSTNARRYPKSAPYDYAETCSEDPEGDIPTPSSGTDLDDLQEERRESESDSDDERRRQVESAPYDYAETADSVSGASMSSSAMCPESSDNGDTTSNSFARSSSTISNATSEQSQGNNVPQVVKEYDQDISANEAIVQAAADILSRLIREKSRSEDGNVQPANFTPRNLREIKTTVTHKLNLMGMLTDHQLRTSLSASISKYQGLEVQLYRDDLLQDISDILYDEMIFKRVLNQVDKSYADEISHLQSIGKGSEVDAQVLSLHRARISDLEKLHNGRLKRLNGDATGSDAGSDFNSANDRNDSSNTSNNSSLYRQNSKQLDESYESDMNPSSDLIDDRHLVEQLPSYGVDDDAMSQDSEFTEDDAVRLSKREKPVGNTPPQQQSQSQPQQQPKSQSQAQSKRGVAKDSQPSTATGTSSFVDSESEYSCDGTEGEAVPEYPTPKVTDQTDSEDDGEIGIGDLPSDRFKGLMSREEDMLREMFIQSLPGPSVEGGGKAPPNSRRPSVAPQAEPLAGNPLSGAFPQDRTTKNVTSSTQARQNIESTTLPSSIKKKMVDSFMQHINKYSPNSKGSNNAKSVPSAFGDFSHDESNGNVTGSMNPPTDSETSSASESYQTTSQSETEEEWVPGWVEKDRFLLAKRLSDTVKADIVAKAITEG